MARIVTVTPNPALDMATSVDRVVPGDKLRCRAPRLDPGGGGANVARAIRLMGGEALAWIALGGGTGIDYRKLLEREGIEAAVFEAPGDTRRTLGVTDEETGEQFRFLVPGADWSEAEADAALEDVCGRLSDGDYAVFSGSLPPGMPGDWPRRFVQMARERGARAVVDTSGVGLDAASEEGAGAHVLRMDRAEAGGLIGVEAPSAEEAETLARDLVARGAAEIAAVTLAGDGAIAVSAEEGWRSRPPKREVVSATGAGDSFVAALVMGLAATAGLGEALRRATAAAAFAVTTPATALVTREGVEETLAETEVSRL
ncbi:MAG TPA: 1-phosphofructokinase family hexose kinase [Paracoccaceae bacterium]|nr:1-phosphofructokinase family hexose kinase [Paracoccaceae bacterium]